MDAISIERPVCACCGERIYGPAKRTERGLVCLAHELDALASRARAASEVMRTAQASQDPTAPVNVAFREYGECVQAIMRANPSHPFLHETA